MAQVRNELIDLFNNHYKKIVIELNAVKTFTVKNKFGVGTAQQYAIELKTIKGSYKTTFTDSVYNYENKKALNKDDVIYSLISDAGCYESSLDFQDFCINFGYEDMHKLNEAYRIYNACKETSEKLNELFTSEELERLRDLFSDY